MQANGPAVRTLRQRCERVGWLVLDVDGVLTGGAIVYGALGAEANLEVKAFHVRDGSALKLWHLAGKRSALITGRSSPVVAVRAAELGVGCVVQGAADKGAALAALLGEQGVDGEAVCYVGDDLPDLSVWDRDDVQAQHSRAVAGGRQITLLTDGMRCAACAWLIDRAMAREPGVVDCTANAVTGRIHLTWDPARTTLSVPLQRLAMLGYRPYLAGSEALERERIRERRRWLLRLGIAGLGTL